MKLSELKKHIDSDLEEFGDLEVFVLYKNVLSGACIESAEDIALLKLGRNNKRPFLCFGISSCHMEADSECSPEDKKKIVEDCDLLLE